MFKICRKIIPQQRKGFPRQKMMMKKKMKSQSLLGKARREKQSEAIKKSIKKVIKTYFVANIYHLLKKKVLFLNQTLQ